MAVIWSQNIDSNRYEVRSAGGSLRLYRNGIHHTQYNAQRPLSGAIWDLLVATTFFRQPAEINQALILGFGAGAAGQVLRQTVSPKRIIGIDLDPIHLSIASGFFDCGSGFELTVGDAIAWVNDHAPSHRRSFDWILEDIYGENGNIPQRCAPSTKAWFSKLAGMLTPNGMLVVNMVEPSEIKHLPLFTDARLIKRFPHVVQFSLPAYDNRILAFSRTAFDKSAYKQNVENFYTRFPRCRRVAEKYRIRRMRTEKS